MPRLRRLIPVLVVLGAVGAVAMWRFSRPLPPTIVLISIDTTRPDRLGAYGNTADVSPNIDALARDGVVFTQALALSPWTLPSHMSMLTGLDPIAHGVQNSDYRLSGKVTTLAEALRGATWRTAAFTDGGFVNKQYGFGAGFEIYRDRMGEDNKPMGFRGTLPEALDWLREVRHEPAFLFLHTFDAHTPYDEGDPDVLEEFRSRPVKDGPDDWQLHRLQYLYEQNQQRVTRYGRMGELLNDYDAGLHEADRGVGQVIETLRELGRLENALIIVTSDHGEAFAERGLHVGHGLALTDDELHVPLVVRLPGREAAGRRVDTQVDLLDIASTALDFARVPVPEAMEGESLLGLLRGQPRRRDWTMGESQNTAQAFIVTGGYKFISPPALDPFDIAKRHLGPMTPPAGEAGEEGDQYEMGHKGSGILLKYDFHGDPLGVRDAIPQVPQVYDRAKDPQELHNLWNPDDPASDELVRKLADKLQAVMAASEEKQKQLDDGLEAQPIDVQQATQLKMIGYISLQQGGGRQLLSQLPRALRDALKMPYRPPDKTQLVYGDRAAHVARLLLQSGKPAPPGLRDQLESIGDSYVRWLSQNDGFLPRVLWRIEALRTLGDKAGLPLDVDRWLARLVDLKGRQDHAPAKPAPGSSGGSPSGGSSAGDSPDGAADPPKAQPSPGPADNASPPAADAPR